MPARSADLLAAEAQAVRRWHRLGNWLSFWPGMARYRYRQRQSLPKLIHAEWSKTSSIANKGVRSESAAFSNNHTVRYTIILSIQYFHYYYKHLPT